MLVYIYIFIYLYIFIYIFIYIYVVIVIVTICYSYLFQFICLRDKIPFKLKDDLQDFKFKSWIILFLTQTFNRGFIFDEYV